MTQASVLVVEDNDLERQITADTLREEGFAVEEAPEPHGRQIARGKAGFIDAELRPILERLGVQPESWLESIDRLAQWIERLAGRAAMVLQRSDGASPDARQEGFL